MNVSIFLTSKIEGRKLSLVTCYDYTFARLLSKSSVDALLVGDSAAMVMHGHPSTLQATLEIMRLHTEAVVRGAGKKCVIADMPFLTFRKGVSAALEVAQALMSAGAAAVKLEGVRGHEDVVQRLVESGIPVMGHLGLEPQSMRRYGGYHVQGRDEDQARKILDHARVLEELGAFAVVLECIPSSLAAKISVALKIPTIGIGAGVACDGQILVLQDLLGLNTDFHPRFARTFADIGQCVLAAIESYDRAVKTEQFPASEESFT
jgi:3-methyl-2-oxobutanoate hydroxymethyltransferase